MGRKGISRGTELPSGSYRQSGKQCIGRADRGCRIRHGTPAPDRPHAMYFQTEGAAPNPPAGRFGEICRRPANCWAAGDVIHPSQGINIFVELEIFFMTTRLWLAMLASSFLLA